MTFRASPADLRSAQRSIRIRIRIMNVDSPTLPLVCIGDDEPCGSYVLRIVVGDHLTMPFGRFKRGKLIEVQPGHYAYVGSAMALRGATSLAKRLLRHSSRSGEQPPHPIQATMLSQFPKLGVASNELQAPTDKRLRWHVDYLLDKSSVELVAAYVVRSSLVLEPSIGDMLEGDPHTVVFEPGLRASDRPGSTYLLRVEAEESWWRRLANRLRSLRLIDSGTATQSGLSIAESPQSGGLSTFRSTARQAQRP